MGGVSSLIHYVSIRLSYFQRLIDFFYSDTINLPKLTKLWIKVVFKIFQPFIITLRECPVLVLDGINIAKEGRRMSGVQCLHQASDSNSKVEYIMGHFFQPLENLFGVAADQSSVCLALYSLAMASKLASFCPFWAFRCMEGSIPWGH